MEKYYRVVVRPTSASQNAIWKRRGMSLFLNVPSMSWISYDSTDIEFFHVHIVERTIYTGSRCGDVVYDFKYDKVRYVNSDTIKCDGSLSRIVYSTDDSLDADPIPYESIVSLVRFFNNNTHLPTYVNYDLDTYFKDIPEHKIYSISSDIERILTDMCQLGMKLRDEQLNGSDRTEVDVVKDYLKKL